MKAEYINCSKCGTRNFADDKVCGVCKSTLNNQVKNEQKIKTTANPLKTLLIILGIGFVIYCFIPTNNSEELGSKQSDINIPEVALAVIQDKRNPPDEITLNLFKEILNSVSNHYPNSTKKTISNELVIGHDLAYNDGYKVSLLEFSTEFKAYLDQIKDGLFSIEEAIALYVKFVVSQ
ncbi:MAG: hypothetical protein JJE22_13395 [Bacteroidia bacterium]|nr:hypothetical protein [Bacteroidia bacterium]